jgi:hypothetical protein
MTRTPILIALALVVTLAAAPRLLACSCYGLGSFRTPATMKGAIVIHGVVRSYITRPADGRAIAMNVEVRDVLRGTLRERTLHVAGDTGASCVPSVTSFPVSTAWVFAISTPDPVRPDSVWHFAPCTNAWLIAYGDHASGWFDNYQHREVLIRDVPALIAGKETATAPAFTSVPRSTAARMTTPVLEGKRSLSRGSCTVTRLAVEVVIDGGGNIRNTALSPSIPACRNAVLPQIASQWRFKPATRDGVPAVVKHTVDVLLQE